VSSYILSIVVVKHQVFIFSSRIVGLSLFKMSATEQRVNITFCDVLHRSPSETLRIPEEAMAMTMKETQVYE
jgi:hypothetical protein